MLPILAKDLAVTLRNRRSFVAAGIMFCVLIAAVCWSFAEAGNTSDRASFARNSFDAAFFFQFLGLVLYVSGQGLRTVREEREESRLDLLLVTPRSPALMLLEKILAPILIGCLFLFGSLPFYAIQFLMGGIGGTELTVRVVHLTLWMISASVVGAFSGLMMAGEKSSVIVNFGILGSLGTFALLVSGHSGMENFPLRFASHIFSTFIFFFMALYWWTSSNPSLIRVLTLKPEAKRDPSPGAGFEPFDEGWRAVYQLQLGHGMDSSSPRFMNVAFVTLWPVVVLLTALVLNFEFSLPEGLILLLFGLTYLFEIVTTTVRTGRTGRLLSNRLSGRDMGVQCVPIPRYRLILGILLAEYRMSLGHFAIIVVIGTAAASLFVWYFERYSWFFPFFHTLSFGLSILLLLAIMVTISTLCAVNKSRAAAIVLPAGILGFIPLVFLYSPYIGPSTSVQVLSSLVIVALGIVWHGDFLNQMISKEQLAWKWKAHFPGKLLVLFGIVTLFAGLQSDWRSGLEPLMLRTLNYLVILAGSIGLLYWILESGD